MKKLRFILPAVIVLALCFCLSGCGESELSSFEGKTFTGSSPWEEEMSITVDKVDGDTIDIEYVENVNGKAVVDEELEGVTVKDNVAGISFSKNDADEEYCYEMKGSLEFRDGKIYVTYTDGSKIENSSEGGSSFHNVQALEDDQKTVELK